MWETNAFLIPLEWMLLPSICDHEKKEETNLSFCRRGKKFVPLSSSSKIVATSHPNNNHPPPPFTPGKLLPDSQPPPLVDAYSNGYTCAPSVTPGVKRHGLFCLFLFICSSKKVFYVRNFLSLSAFYPSSLILFLR